MNFLDLFAGIGGFRLGMEQAGHKCIGYVEIDKFARKSYEAIHDTEGEWTAHDITTVTDESIRGIGRVDVITGGFPCQAFSVAGKRGGFNDTRGTLFFEVARFASILRPQYLFLENVTGLLNHEDGNTFETIIGALDEIGYDAEWDCLNSKNFGVPQNRDRVFIIGHLRNGGTRKVFPVSASGREINDSNITTGTLTARYPASQREGTYIEEVRDKGRKIEVVGRLKEKGHDQRMRVYDPKGLSPCLNGIGNGGNHEPKIIQAVLTPDREEKRQNGRRIKEPGEPMFTLTSQDRHGVAISIDLKSEKSTTRRGMYKEEYVGALDTQCNVGVAVQDNGVMCLNTKDENGKQPPQQDRIYSTEGVMTTISAELSGRFNIKKPSDYRIRRLTPRECFRLQGFPDWAFDRAAEVNSDSQLYKQAGNSVSVPVIYEIARKLVE
jgi:DNA (cytosine-5)-methyltransferase 1